MAAILMYSRLTFMDKINDSKILILLLYDFFLKYTLLYMDYSLKFHTFVAFRLVISTCSYFPPTSPKVPKTSPPQGDAQPKRKIQLEYSGCLFANLTRAKVI